MHADDGGRSIISRRTDRRRGERQSAAADQILWRPHPSRRLSCREFCELSNRQSPQHRDCRPVQTVIGPDAGNCTSFGSWSSRDGEQSVAPAGQRRGQGDARLSVVEQHFARVLAGDVNVAVRADRDAGRALQAGSTGWRAARNAARHRIARFVVETENAIELEVAPRMSAAQCPGTEPATSARTSSQPIDRRRPDAFLIMGSSSEVGRRSGRQNRR